MSKENKKKSGSNLNFLFVVGLILAILMIVFAIQNSNPTEIDFFTLKVSPPLALLIIICIALGSAMTLIFSIPGWFRRRASKNELEKELKQLQKNYDELVKVKGEKVEKKAE